MNSSKITSLFLLILLIVSLSGALARVLLAVENPNPNKDTQRADKEQNQNPDPQKSVDSQLNSSDSENVKDAAQSKLTENNTKDKEQKVSNDTSSNKDKMGDIKKEIDGKSKSGKEENIGPSKRDDSSQENKESKERDDSSQGNGKNNNETEGINKSSQENGKMKVESKESNNTSKSQENNDDNGKPKESNIPSNNQEIGKKNDELKESNDTTNGQENGKMNNESKESSDPSNNKEKVKKNEEPIETSALSKGQVNDKKDAGMKEDIGPHKRGEKDKSDGKKESKDDGKNVDGKQEVKLPTENTCDVSLQKCQKYDLVACLQHSEIDSTKFVISVQNMGDDSLTVNITVPPSVKINSNMLILAKHSSQKISISSYNTKSLKVVLNAGKGNCTIQIGIGPSIADWFQQFPAYANQVTPTYVAYILLITLIIVGVVFGFCKFRRRGKRVDNGVNYQQLEMGNQIQSNSDVVEASTVDGWNQGWDDDWDEEEEIPMPQNSNSNGNLLSNGLSSRPANRRSDWDE